MTPLQAPGDHEALLASIASRDSAKIRTVFARVFDDGRRVVASAVEEDAAASNDEAAGAPIVELLTVEARSK